MRNHNVCKTPQTVISKSSQPSSSTFVWSGLWQLKKPVIGDVNGVFGSDSGLGFVWVFWGALCVFSQMLFFCFVLLGLDCFPSEWYKLKLPQRPGALLISVLSPKKSRRRSDGFVLFALWFSFPRSLSEQMWENENGIGCVELFFDCSGAVNECCRTNFVFFFCFPS